MTIRPKLSAPASLTFCAALLLFSAQFSFATEALHLPKTLSGLDHSGAWHNALEELSLQGVPQSWTVLGPFSNENVKLFEKQLDPEKTDDWNGPLTDNMGRVFKPTEWIKPKDDDGCYVDLYDLFNAPPPSPVIFAGAEIFSPIDGPALLWFENAGRAIVYFNNQVVLGAATKTGVGTSGRKSRYEGQINALYPVPVELKRGRNFLKIKLLKDRKEGLKGWGFFARIERQDLDWRLQLAAKLKERYPEDDAGAPGADMRITLARAYERGEKSAEALELYKTVNAQYSRFNDAHDEAVDAQRRINEKLRQPDANSAKEWTDASARFRIQIDAGRAREADQVMRDFLMRFPFAEESGLALCHRGGLRLDYAFDESARPFLDRAAREFSRNETVRRLSIKGLEFARFFKPQHEHVETTRDVEVSFAAIVRQIQNGNKVDGANGLKSLGDLLLAQPGALIRAGGSELYPRFASLNQVAREFSNTLGADEKKMLREHLSRAAQSAYRQFAGGKDPVALEEVARKFPGAAASARALNDAGNLYLDRAQFARAAYVFKILRTEYSGTSLTNDALVAAKEIRALAGQNQAAPARELIRTFAKNFGAAKISHAGAELTGSELATRLERILATARPDSAGSNSKQSETFAGNAQRTGSASPAPIPATLQWSRPFKTSEFANRARGNWSEDKLFSHFESFPVVSNGRVFISNREQVRAFDAKNGNELWSKNWNNPGYVYIDKFAGFPQSLPSIQNERLYVRVVNPEKYSVLRCFAAGSGKQEWETDQIPALKKLYFSSEPLVVHNLVCAVFFELLDRDTCRYGMAALDARTGALVWRRDFGIGNSGVQIAEKSRETKSTQILYRVTLQLGPPSEMDGIIYTATGLNSIAALNASTGEIVWMTAYPKLRAGNLYTGNSGIENFMPRMLKTLARGPSSPVVTEEIVALAPKDSTGLMAFDRTSGELRWALELMDARFIAGVSGDNLLAVDDTVSAINLKTGKVAWEYSGDGKKLVTQPGYSGGMLYLPYDDGLQMLDAAIGKPLQRIKWDPKLGGAAGNFVVTENAIIGVNNNNLVSIGAAKK